MKTKLKELFSKASGSFVGVVSAILLLYCFAYWAFAFFYTPFKFLFDLCVR